MKAPDTKNVKHASSVQRLSVSLFPADLERLEAIADFLRERKGVRVNTSQALKLALRGVTIGDGLLRAWDEILTDDGRRRKPNENLDRDMALARRMREHLSRQA